MSYPVTQTSPIGNSVTAKTVIILSGGSQVANVEFLYEDSVYQSVVLTSQGSTTSKTFNINKGEVIVTLQFTAASGFTLGSVSAKGSVTDQNGENKQDFDKQIASWGN